MGEAIIITTIGQGIPILAIGITIPGTLQGIGDTIAGDMVAGKVSAVGRRIRRRRERKE